MHIPDGFLDSKTAAGLGLAAASLLGYAFNKVQQTVTELGLAPAFANAAKSVRGLSGKAKTVLSSVGKEYLLKLAGVTSLVFAAQMFNFPISSGTSGHLLGGVLAALLLGPWGAAVAISSVLIIQALFYADGGLIVLGANIFNMAGVGCIGGYFLYKLFRQIKITHILSVGIAAWASLVLAALACALEVGFSGTYELKTIVQAMLSVHAIIGIGEAIITLALLEFAKKTMNWEVYNEGK